MLRREVITVTTTGGVGVSAGSAYSANVINGRIIALHFDFAGTAPGATTDVTVTPKSAPSDNIVALVDTATDAWVYPRRQVHDNAGSGLTLDGTRIMAEPYVIQDYLKVAVAQCNDLDPAVTVTVFWEE